MSATTVPLLWGEYTDHSATESSNLVQYLSPRKDDIKTTLEVIKSIDQLSKKTIGIIGAHGLNRFEDFKKYKSGWDNGTGKALSFRSVGVMEYFINIFNHFHSEPSIFLTREGNLQLNWEEKNGQSIEIEFFSDKIEYYIESRDLECSVKADNTGLRSLKKIIEA